MTDDMTLAQLEAELVWRADEGGWPEIRPGWGGPTVCGVYAIMAGPNERVYIGSSVDVRRRLAAHRAQLRSGAHSNPYLQAAWLKHGEDHFTFHLLSVCAPSELLWAEQVYLDTESSCIYNSNLTAGKPPSRLGQRNSPEHKAKVAAANLGKKQRRTPEWNANISRGLLGKKRDAAFREACRVRALGKTQSAETRAKKSVAMRGRDLGPLHRQRCREARLRTIARKRGLA